MLLVCVTAFWSIAVAAALAPRGSGERRGSRVRVPLVVAGLLLMWGIVAAFFVGFG